MEKNHVFFFLKKVCVWGGCQSNHTFLQRLCHQGRVSPLLYLCILKFVWVSLLQFFCFLLSIWASRSHICLQCIFKGQGKKKTIFSSTCGVASVSGHESYQHDVIRLSVTPQTIITYYTSKRYTPLKLYTYYPVCLWAVWSDFEGRQQLANVFTID